MKRYRTIVVDPPWRYVAGWPVGRTARGVTHDGRRTPIGYKTMTVAEISALPIRKLAEPSQCHIYLWTTNRYLRAAFDVLMSWGATYSQSLVWCKIPMGRGPGGAFAQNAEFILFARIGSLGAMRRQPSVWFNWPRTGCHSQKPEGFLDLVEQVSPAPRLELFARRNRLGWDTWGNEALNHVQITNGPSADRSTSDSENPEQVRGELVTPATDTP